MIKLGSVRIEHKGRKTVTWPEIENGPTVPRKGMGNTKITVGYVQIRYEHDGDFAWRWTISISGRTINGRWLGSKYYDYEALNLIPDWLYNLVIDNHPDKETVSAD